MTNGRDLPVLLLARPYRSTMLILPSSLIELRHQILERDLTDNSSTHLVPALTPRKPKLEFL